MERMAKKFDFAASSHFANLIWGYNFSIGDKAWLEPARDGLFKGCKFTVPCDSDSVLRIDFGNYMQLPPPEKRVSRHNFQAFWIVPPKS